MPRRGSSLASIEVHLYGKLRRACGQVHPTGDCILHIPISDGEIVVDVINRLGFTEKDLGLIFINGQLAAIHASMRPGDRLGLFPDDQRLLYKWYFPKVER